MRFLIILLFVPAVLSCNILALSGGGAHGAYQAGVMKQLHEKGKNWDIITGISVGSINGIGLGLFNRSRQIDGIQMLENMWTNITTSNVYEWNWNPIGDQSLLDNTPLNKTLTMIVKKYGGKIKRNLLIGAVNLNTGLLNLFTNKDFISPFQITQTVMASSSIPLVFPPTYLNGHYYVDGGTYSNEVIRPAITSCLNHGVNKSEISIDIIICSPPIDTISNQAIQSDYIFGLMSRSYNILINALENRELYTRCPSNQHNYPMYIYKPDKTYPGGLLDFEHKDLVNMYEIGYSTGKPTVSEYCY